MSDVENLRPSTSSLFNPEDGQAVIIAISKANDKGHTSTVTGLEVVGDVKNENCRIFGKPFRLHDKLGRYIWLNHYLRQERLNVGSIISYENFKHAYRRVDRRYYGNTAQRMEMNKVISQLQFGEQHYAAVAHQGIADAFPCAEIRCCGIYRQNDSYLPPEFALVSMKTAYTLDERIVFRTQLNEVCNLKNNCRLTRQCNIGKTNLPVCALSSEEDVGDVVLIKMESPDKSGQAICEGVLTKTPELLQSYDHHKTRNPRGKCVIINNAHFSNEKLNRRGAEHDVRELAHLFEYLSFDVVVKEDLKFEEMRQLAIEFAEVDHSQLEAFVFIIMSHGDSPDLVYDVDERPVRIEDLISEYKASRCPTLAGKPKLFFLQSCRGKLREGISVCRENCTGRSSKCDEDGCVGRVATESMLPRTTVPKEADFLLAFSTAPGYVSMRNEDEGSWFIQVLVNVIRKFHDRCHLLEMLTEVNRVVIEEGQIQVPNPSYTLRAKVWL